MEVGNYEYTSWIIAGIIFFFILRLIIGYLASRRVKASVDFIVAGRRMPIYMAGASIMATWFAAETLMGASATAYLWGFHGVIFDPFGSVLCLLLSGFLFVRLMRRAQYLTAMDFFEQRFGRVMSVAGSVAQIIAYFGWTAAQIVAGGNIIHVIFGTPVAVGMIAVATIVTLYTTLGGMWADTLLDFIQVFLSMIGISLIFYAVIQAVGGWQVFTNQASSLFQPDAFRILPDEGGQYLGYGGVFGWLYWIAAWLAVGFGSLPAQDLMQRSMSARNESVAVYGTYLAGFLYGAFGILSPLVGIALFILHPGLAPAETEFILVSASLEYLPPLLATFFIAALSSALMSTSDSSVLSGASLFTENILPVFVRDMNDRSQLRWTRIMVLVIGFISLLIALFAGTIYRLAILAWSVLLVGLVAPFALGMYWKKANRTGAISSLVGGFASWALILILLYPMTLAANNGDIDNAIWDAAYISSTPAFLIAVILMVAVSLLTLKSDPPRQLRNWEAKSMEMVDRLGILPLQDAFGFSTTQDGTDHPED